MRLRVLVYAAVAAALLAPPHAARAHTRSQSFSSWSVEDGVVRVVFSVPAFEVTRLAILEPETSSLDEMLAAHLEKEVSLSSDAGACVAGSKPRILTAREGSMRAEWSFHCPSGAGLLLYDGAFFEVAPSHVHYARVRGRGGAPLEYLFTDSERRHVIATGDSSGPAGTSFGAYVLLGVQHIFAGSDHIAFLFALLLLCRRVREVLLMITGFTLGHSVTLSLAVLGVIRPNTSVIEALIGFTIALVGAENIGVRGGSCGAIAKIGATALLCLAAVAATTGVGPPLATLFGLALFTACYLPLSDSQETATRLRPTLTALFGLVHGFGFARVLMEIGIPSDRLLPALFGFNLGVEMGQLAIVAVAALAGTLLLRALSQARRELGFELASAALCGLGLFWFVQRAFAAF